MKHLFILLCILWVTPVYAQQVIQISPDSLEINKSRPSAKDNTEEELQIAREVLLKQKQVRSSISSNETYGTFRFEILSRVETVIKVRWQDTSIDYTGKVKDTYRLTKNTGRGFTFLAVEPTKGIIEILNENDELILIIPYEVDKEGNGKNSISLSANSKLGDINPRLNVRYSHTKRNISGGTWSYRVGASGSVDDLPSVNVNMGVTHSW